MSEEIFRIEDDNELFYGEQIKEIIDEFFDDFFNEEYEVIRFNINFLENNNFQYQTKVDYIQLNRFIATSINTLKSIDANIIDPLITKFYKDIIYLNDLYKNFLTKTKSTDSVFKNNFLKTCGGVEGIYYRIQKSLNKDKNPVAPTQEDLNKLLNITKDDFLKEIKIKNRYYFTELKKIINTKSYYFDRLLWSDAKRNKAVLDFFKKNKNTDGEYDEISMKTFIKKYLKTINMSQVKEPEWHQYLQKVINIME